ncbi:hypothetical protein CEQ90_01850 [Lewinellaceae bacterium SD302]|nr:hypothetical protein CEQ90_01850 [Lewinellaceae bacterium SD302]
MDRLAYRQFVAAYPGLPVFYRDWWLDAACGEDNWSYALAKDKDGAPASIWPYYHRKKFGGLIRMIDKPPFSPHCGPFITSAPESMNPAKVLDRQKRLVDQLTEQLPAFTYGRAGTNYDFGATHPLRLAGWRAQQLISYRLRTDLYSLPDLYERLSGKVRTNLRDHDQLSSQIEPLTDFGVLADLQQRILGYQSSNDLKVLRRLYSVTNEKDGGIGWLFRAVDGEPTAVIWLAYDQNSAYLLVAAADPKRRQEDQAITQLIWRAINWCNEQKIIFDFEGSALPGVEQFYRGWGPEEGQYLLLSKGPGW